MNEPLGKLAAGRHEAFSRLYNALADRLHHYLVVQLGSRDDADDVLQETFVRLARHHQKLVEVDNLSAYVFRIARNEALRYRERRARRADKETPLSAEDLFEPSNDAARLADIEETVAEGLARLGADHREVVELKTFAGLTLAEIAEVFGLPQGTVASRYRAALARLRRVLQKDLS